MIIKDKRLLGTIAGAMALAAVAGFGLARCTADPTSAAAAESEAEADDETAPDTLEITPEAIKMAEIGVETVGAGGLDSEIIAQARRTCDALGLYALIVIGGDGSLATALQLHCQTGAQWLAATKSVHPLAQQLQAPGWRVVSPQAQHWCAGSGLSPVQCGDAPADC